MMDPATVIKELGGGLSATLIVAQAGAIFYLVKWIRDIQSGRVADMREANKLHQELTREVAKSLDALTERVRDGR